MLRSQHASAQHDFGPMEKNGDVPGGDPQRLRYVLAPLFLNHAESDDSSLDFAELFDALAEPDVVLGPCEEIVGRRGPLAGEWMIVEAVVRPRTKMPPPPVAGGVAHHPGQHPGPLRLSWQATGRGSIEQRAERLLQAVDGVFGP